MTFRTRPDSGSRTTPSTCPMRVGPKKISVPTSFSSSVPPDVCMVVTVPRSSWNLDADGLEHDEHEPQPYAGKAGDDDNRHAGFHAGPLVVTSPLSTQR